MSRGEPQADEAWQIEKISLLDADADLRAGVPADDVDLARRVVVAPVLRIPAGQWTVPPPETLAARTLALLVLDGILTRESFGGGRSSAKLVGPQEMLDPWVEDDEAPCPVVVWRARTEARLAVLDERFLAAARRWPGLFEQVCRRQALQSARDARHLAIMHITPIEQRVHAMLRHLGARWGRVGPDGVVLPLPLTHEALGRLVGAQRPTVSLALAALDAEGLIVRRPDGLWVLREPREALSLDAAAAGSTSPLRAPAPVAAHR